MQKIHAFSYREYFFILYASHINHSNHRLLLFQKPAITPGKLLKTEIMNYNEIINSNKVVLVEFFASWCPHCQRMMPVVEQVKEKLGDRASVYQFDIDKYQTLTEENDVESYPTFIIYKDGQEVWRSEGEMPGDELYREVAKYF